MAVIKLLIAWENRTQNKMWPTASKRGQERWKIHKCTLNSLPTAKDLLAMAVFFPHIPMCLGFIFLPRHSLPNVEISVSWRFLSLVKTLNIYWVKLNCLCILTACNWGCIEKKSYIKIGNEKIQNMIIL